MSDNTGLVGQLTYIGLSAGGWNVLLQTIVTELFRYLHQVPVSRSLLRDKLKTTVLVLSAVLVNAREKQITNLAVLEWLNELESLLYDAQDIEDEIQTELLKLNNEAESQLPVVIDHENGEAFANIDPTMLENLCSDAKGIGQLLAARLSKTPHADDSILCPLLAKLENICERLDVILPHVSILGFAESLEIQYKKPPIISFSNCSAAHEPGILGRDPEFQEMISVLKPRGNQQDDGFCVAAVTGIPGIGKTAFAGRLYHDEIFSSKFNVKCWVSASEIASAHGGPEIITHLTKAIFRSLVLGGTEPKTLLETQIKLSKALLGKNLLLVLDDIVSDLLDEKSIEKLFHPFKASGNIVTVIITTSNIIAAAKFSPYKTIKLSSLSTDDSWLLLKRIAFGACENEAYTETGKKIAEKCQGIPLLLKVLGGILRFWPYQDVWEAILNREEWMLPVGVNDIHPALRLSYNYLPFHLKSSFAYCSMFPKNFKFDREMLVSLWISEGFVQVPKGDSFVQELGGEIFEALVSCAMFQRCLSSPGRSDPYGMHHLIHDLAVHFGEFYFMLPPKSKTLIPPKTRHLSYIQATHDKLDYFDATLNNFSFSKKPGTVEKSLGISGRTKKERSHVRFHRFRTFLPVSLHSKSNCLIDRERLDNLLSELTCLRVLSLSHYAIDNISSSSNEFIHLRLLNLSHTPIEKLPEFVCNLYNLQTLLLLDCRYLNSLPENFGNLVSLRHLDLNGTDSLKELPAQISKLNGICTLTKFVVSSGKGANIAALKEFHNLKGQLTISKLENVSKSDARIPRMLNTEYLDELNLEWTRPGQTLESLNEERILCKLRPSKNLEKLTIISYGGSSFPDWVNDAAYSNIASIHLVNCYLCVSLPSLGSLPSLKELYVENFASLETVGQGFYGNSNNNVFQALEVLRFEKLPEWATWLSHQCQGKQPFAKLKSFILIACPELSGSLPAAFPSLETLEIKGCKKLRGPIPRLPSTCVLKLQGCEALELTNTSEEVGRLVALDIRRAVTSSFLFNLQTLTSLEELRVQGFQTFDNLLISTSGAIPQPPNSLLIHNSIQVLSIVDCSFELTGEPNSLRFLTVSNCANVTLNTTLFSSLMSLHIHKCTSLVTFQFELFTLLAHLTIEDCSKLNNITVSPVNLSLYELSITSCPELKGFPNGGLRAERLVSFSIKNCQLLESLPQEMKQQFVSLELMSLMKCPVLASFIPDCVPQNLRILEVRDCKLLTRGVTTDWELPESVTVHVTVPKNPFKLCFHIRSHHRGTWTHLLDA